MNKNNILNEGFFDKLFRKLGIKDKAEQNKIKTDRKLSGAIKNLNRVQNDLEDWYNELRKRRGESSKKLRRYSVDDFI